MMVFPRGKSKGKGIKRKVDFKEPSQAGGREVYIGTFVKGMCCQE